MDCADRQEIASSCDEDHEEGGKEKSEIFPRLVGPEIDTEEDGGGSKVVPGHIAPGPNDNSIQPWSKEENDSNDDDGFLFVAGEADGDLVEHGCDIVEEADGHDDEDGGACDEEEEGGCRFWVVLEVVCRHDGVMGGSEQMIFHGWNNQILIFILLQ